MLSPLPELRERLAPVGGRGICDRRSPCRRAGIRLILVMASWPIPSTPSCERIVYAASEDIATLGRAR